MNEWPTVTCSNPEFLIPDSYEWFHVQSTELYPVLDQSWHWFNKATHCLSNEVMLKQWKCVYILLQRLHGYCQMLLWHGIVEENVSSAGVPSIIITATSCYYDTAYHSSTMIQTAATRLTMIASRLLRRLIFCIKLLTTGNRSDRLCQAGKLHTTIKYLSTNTSNTLIMSYTSSTMTLFRHILTRKTANIVLQIHEGFFFSNCTWKPKNTFLRSQLQTNAIYAIIKYITKLSMRVTLGKLR